MPNILDGMTILPPIKNPKQICPICGKAAHPDKTTTAKKEKKGCLKSIPANLGCTPLAQLPNLPNYTTAAHHLIPANQCLKPFPRLSQMADTVGYDVNNSNNGISLPTCAQADLNQYKNEGGKMVNYGSLEDKDKDRVAFAIMRGTNKQWHVGHHKWVISLDNDTDKYKHVDNYDKLVKQKLRNVELKIEEQGESICEPKDKQKESGQDVIDKLNSLSEEIRGYVESWNDYYVSEKAMRFKKEQRG